MSCIINFKPVVHNTPAMRKTTNLVKRRIEYNQEKILSNISWLLYYLGMGDLRYSESEENMVESIFQTKKQIIYSIFVIGIAFTFTTAEFLALFLRDLPPGKFLGGVSFSAGHITSMGKIFAVLYHGKAMRKIFYRIEVELPKIYYNHKSNTFFAWKCKINAIFLTLTVIATFLTLYIEEHLRTQDTDDHFEPLVIYWPIGRDSILTNITAQMFQHIGTFVIVTSFIAVDSVTIYMLLLLTAQFILVNEYFRNVHSIAIDQLYSSIVPKIYGKKSLEERRIIVEDYFSRSSITDEFKMQYIRAMTMHGSAIECAKWTQNAFGLIFSFQVVEGMMMLISVLARMVTDRGLSSLLSSLALMSCLLCQIGQYCWYAGNITYEAERVATSIFMSGWQHCNRTVKPYVILSTAHAQRPLVMYALGLVDLSYSTYVSILRRAYSVFAILY